MKKNRKTHKKKRKTNPDEYIGFKLIKPVPQSELLADYEQLKNSTLPSALKATKIANLLSKETIENQSKIEEIERDQYQIDTSIKTTPVSNLDQYQNETGIAESKTTKTQKKEISQINIKEIPDTVNEKIKFKPGFFSQWESSIFNELRKTLTNSEFKIYTVLFEESWTYGKNITGIIGYKTISERTGLGRATVIRNIEKLIKRKIIEKRKTFNNLGTIYKVNLPETAEIQINPENDPQNQYQNDTSTSIKMIPVLVSKRYQSPPNLDEETIENQSNPESNIYINNIYNTYNGKTIENQSLPKFNISEEDKELFQNNLIKILNQDEIKKTLTSKPFSLKENIVETLINSASPELLSLKIENALFNYRKKLIKKPGEWILLAIYNRYKTSKQFLKHLKEKQKRKEKENIPDPVNEYLIKTVFGYHTKFLRNMPSKEILIKELQRYNIPEQTINHIINNYPPEYVFFQIKHADFRRPEIKEPTTWLINAITKVYKPNREFARRIESLIKEIENEKLNEERNRKIEEERKKIENALNTFKSLPETKQNEILKIAQEELKKLNITPDTPGYKINLEYQIAKLITSTETKP